LSRNYSLGQFAEDAGRSLDGDLRRWSLDLIWILRVSFLENLEARLDVQARKFLETQIGFVGSWNIKETSLYFFSSRFYRRILFKYPNTLFGDKFVRRENGDSPRRRRNCTFIKFLKSTEEMKWNLVKRFITRCRIRESLVDTIAWLWDTARVSDIDHVTLHTKFYILVDIVLHIYDEILSSVLRADYW